MIASLSYNIYDRVVRSSNVTATGTTSTNNEAIGRGWTLSLLLGLAFLCFALRADAIVGSGHQLLPAIKGIGPAPRCMSKGSLAGDWIAQGEIVAAGQPAHATFIFATRPGMKKYLALEVRQDRVELMRHSPSPLSLAQYAGAGALPWNLKVWRRGAYYFFEINAVYLGFTFHPSGNLEEEPVTSPDIEPQFTHFGVRFPSAGKYLFQKFHASSISFGKRSVVPIISPGLAGSWNQAEVFPGSILRYGQTYYMYLNGTDWTSKSLEGGGHTRTGLSVSNDLVHWTVDPRGVVLGLGPKGSWDSTLVMVNGATRTPDGRIAITYMGFDGKTWSGIGLATGDRPEGPFTKYAGNPVLRADPNSWDTVIHEHTLYRDGDRYVLFYTGFDGHKGDRGGLAYSHDLIHWTKDPANPVFVDEGPYRWSSLHLRPRSLFRRNEYFYLFYEGAGTRPKFSKHESGVGLKEQLVFDSVGLARSKDLYHWEVFPWNPAIPQTGGKTFDALWTGWPLAVQGPDRLFVYYAASDAWGFARKQGRVSTGLIQIGYQELDNWAGMSK